MGYGFSSDETASAFAESHEYYDTYVYTWLGDTPDELWREALRRVGPGRVNYVWAGMSWYVSVVLSTDDARRDPVTGQRPRVQLNWGDLVIIYGDRTTNRIATDDVIVWRISSHETFR